MARIYRDLPSYKRQGQWRHRILKALVFLIALYLVLVILESFFIRTVPVVSESMEPGLPVASRILLSPLVFGKVLPFSNAPILDFAQPKRGQIVQIVPPYQKEASFLQKILSSFLRVFTLGYVSLDSENTWENQAVLRRVIALEGDEVFYSAGIFMVKKAGTENFVSEFEAAGKTWAVKEPENPELDPDAVLADQSRVYTLASGQIFVASDNRQGFLDSRHWGLLNLDRLRGLALIRFWPLKSFSLL